MPRFSRVIWLACLCSLWSCSKKDAASTAQDGSKADPQAAAVTTADGAKPAADAASKATTVTPEQAEQIADRLIAARNYRQALPILTQVIKANPKAKEALVKRAAILAESKLLTPAIADMSRAIEVDPQDARLRNTRGYFHLSQQKLKEALQDFSDAIGLDMNYAEPHNNRGLVRIAMGDAKTAVKDFDEAVKIKAKYLDAHNNRGYALMKLENYPEAIASFTTAIEIEPKYVNAWNNRGQAKLKAGQAEQALTDFSEAVRLSPNTLSYHIGRADAYKALGRDAEAQADRDRVAWMQSLGALTQQVARNPKLAANWVARGKHLLKAEEAKAAAADFNKALEIESGNVDARCGRAAVLISVGRFDEAIADCNIALEKELHPMAASLRGDAYFAKGDLDKAIEDYVFAKRVDSHVAQAYLKRSEHYRKEGKTAEAEADLTQAVTLDPSLDTVRQASNEQPDNK
jgi:tetratricopeptide (TPR) repeat protein